MSDIFDKFESGIVPWISNRSALWIIPLKLVVVWVIFSLALAGTCGIVGFGVVENNITELYNAGSYPQESYDMWQNVIVPVVVQAFNTLGWLILLIIAFYITFLLYIILKHICRKYGDKPIE